MANGLKSLNRVPFVPVTAALFALVACILVVATPQWLFERAVVSASLPDLIAAAAPPLGDKARILAAIVSAVATGGLLWAVLTPLRNVVKPRLAERARGARIEAAVVFEPDAEPSQPFEPARRPIFAETDLGAPFMSDEAIAHARGELVLDTPLAAPAKVEDVEAIEAPETVEEEARTQKISEPERHQPVEADDADSIAALMNRLENALDRRERRTGSRAPFPGDMTSLRQALGVSRH